MEEQAPSLEQGESCHQVAEKPLYLPLTANPDAAAAVCDAAEWDRSRAASALLLRIYIFALEKKE